MAKPKLKRVNKKKGEKVTKREIKNMRKKLADSFREFAKRHRVADEKVEKFVEEIMDLLTRGPEIPSAKERDKAVKKVLKKYGIEVEENKKPGGSC